MSSQRLAVLSTGYRHGRPEGHQISKVPKWRATLRCFDWSPDGKVLPFRTTKQTRLTPGLPYFRFGDSTVRLAYVTGQVRTSIMPAFARTVRRGFHPRTAAGVVEDLYVSTCRRCTPKRLTFDNTWIDAPPAWTPDGRDIVFAFHAWWFFTLWRISASENATARAGVGAGAFLPSISSKGHRSLPAEFRMALNIWRLNSRTQHIAKATCDCNRRKVRVTGTNFLQTGKGLRSNRIVWGIGNLGLRQ